MSRRILSKFRIQRLIFVRRIEKMKKPLERRFNNCEVRAVPTESGSLITGRPIVYGSRTDLGWFDEIIEPGALDQSDLTDVRFLVNHNTDMIPLARSRRNNGNSTMTLTVVPEGLDMEAVIDTENNATARELKSAIERGDLSGMSFMFSIDDEEWEDLESDHPIRHIRKIGSVVEVSGVTFPAYDATTINARSKEALESARKAVETAKAEARSVETDSNILELEKAKTILLGGN
jgi:HK97 family phage prohead protease